MTKPTPSHSSNGSAIATPAAFGSSEPTKSQSVRSPSTQAGQISQQHGKGQHHEPHHEPPRNLLFTLFDSRLHDRRGRGDGFPMTEPQYRLKYRRNSEATEWSGGGPLIISLPNTQKLIKKANAELGWEKYRILQ